MKSVMGVRMRSERGQPIVEYLVIAAVIVAAILLIQPTVRTNIQNLYNNAAQKTSNAATALGNLNVER